MYLENGHSNDMHVFNTHGRCQVDILDARASTNSYVLSIFD